MANRNQADRIIFQSKKHHRQILRSQIDSSLIDRIEIDRNPSLNYKKAYKSLYNDELQKTVQLIEEKKQKTKQLTKHDPYIFTVGMKEKRFPMIDQTNMSASQLSNYGKRFVDYDQQKTLKYQNHVVKNYDGGQSFFKAHDQHLQKKKFEAKITNKTLGNQLQLKQYMRMKQLQKIKQQNRAFQQLKNRQLLQDQQRLQNEKYQKQAFRQDIVKQIGQQKQRKQMKTKFQYQNLARHNPITNPIQYHIDNPYILKEIQTRNLVKSQSLHQFPRY